MEKIDAPIIEFYDDGMSNLDMFFANGKKEFWRFQEVRELGIETCLIFLPRQFKKLKSIYEKCKLIYEFKSASTLSPVYLYDRRVLIAMCPLGGAAAANLMEELIYVGIKYFIGTGSCGAITEVNINDYFIPTKAIRDEGTSYHYLAPSRYVETSDLLTRALENVLKKHKRDFTTGTVWTTDAIYRETPGRIAQRLKDGATGVEMETASLAAVAKSKGVHYACLLYYSDVNNGKSWNSRFYDLVELRTEIVNLTVETLESVKKARSK